MSETVFLRRERTILDGTDIGLSLIHIWYDRLCELNVIESVANVCQTTIVQDAWSRGQELTIHGWVYGVHDGLIRDLDMTISSLDELPIRKAQSLARYATGQDIICRQRP